MSPVGSEMLGQIVGSVHEQGSLYPHRPEADHMEGHHWLRLGIVGMWLHELGHIRCLRSTRRKHWWPLWRMVDVPSIHEVHWVTKMSLLRHWRWTDNVLNGAANDPSYTYFLFYFILGPFYKKSFL